MIKMHAHSKYIVIILIFIISILVGIKTSDILPALDGPNEIQEAEEITKAFNEAQHYRKLAVIFQGNEINSIIADVDKLSSDPDILVINSARTSSYFHTVLEINNNSFQQNYDQLHQINGFFNEKIDNNNLPEFDVNIDEHINNKELAKNQLQALLKHSVIPERVSQYSLQLEEIQAEIDKLQNQKLQHDKYAKFTLVSVLIKRNIQRSMIILKSLKKFFLNTFLSLLILTIFFSILYFILVNLLRLMKVIGIKTSGSSAAYYYSPKRKKIKRKYKDKEEN